MWAKTSQDQITDWSGGMRGRSRGVRTFLACFTGLVLTARSVLLQKPDGATLCDTGLGVAYGSEVAFGPDAFNSSSGTGAVQGRLQDPTGAWCVARQDVENQALSVSWWVDLGEPRFVIGHKAQGPPEPLAKQDEGHTVKFQVHTSMDAIEWMPLNSDEVIYSTYSTASPADIETVDWKAAALGRFVRFTVDPANFFAGATACMRFELLGCNPNDIKLRTNIRVSSTLTGTSTISWDPPLLWTGVSSDPVTPDDYIASYSLLDSAGQAMPLVQAKTSGNRQLIVSNAYLSAYYTFRVQCVFSLADLIVDGGEVSLSLYPNCPLNWLSSGSECYHSQTATVTWSEVLQRCKRIIDVPSQATPSEPIPEGSKTWMATEGSNDDPKDDGICSILAMKDNDTAVEQEDRCPPDDILPYACSFRKQVSFARPQNFVVNQLADKSVKVTWTDSKDGWRTLSKNVKTLEDTGVSDWVVYSAYGSSFTLTGLENGQHYTITTAPAGPKLEPYPEDAFTIYMMLTNVTLSAYIVWSGAIHLEWTDAVIGTKDGKSIKADSYILDWTHPSDSGGVPEPLTTTSYDMDFPTFGKTYTFYIKCQFPGKLIPCGSEDLVVDTRRTSYDAEGARLLLYSSNVDKLTWEDAELECVKQGGHLASIKDEAEDERVETLAMAQNPYWLGGTNCKGRTKNWLDNSPWTYARPPVKNFQNQSCCLQVAPGDTVYWRGADCKSQASYVCKFDVAVSVSTVQGLKPTVLSSTQVLLQWKPPAKNWRPSYYLVESCSGGKCNEVTRMVTTPAAVVPGLTASTTYDIKVISKVEALGVENEIKVTVTTGPSPPLEYTLNSEGVLKLKWTRKISQGNGGVGVKVQFSETKSTDKTKKEFKGTASETTVTGLKLEKEYSVTVTETAGSDSDTFTTTIRPTCPARQEQYVSLCLWQIDTPGKWSAVNKACRRDGGRLAKADDVNKQLLLGVLAQNKELDHWIDGQELQTDTMHVDAIKAAPEKMQDTDALKTHGEASVEALQNGVKSSTDSTALAELSREIVDEGICQKMKPKTQDIEKSDCTESLPAICQKKVAVILLPVNGLKSSQVTVKSATFTWDPPQSWQPTAYKISLKQAGSRRKRAATLPTNIEVTENKYTTPELQPGTSYVFETKPIMKQDDATIEGKTQTVKFTTQKLLKVESTASAPQAQMKPSDGNPEVKALNNCSYPASLHTFHIIGCSTLVTLVSLSLLIFVACRMHTFRDSLAQINMEFSLLLVHILILVNATSPGEMDFQAAAISIHFFFMVSFAFLALECICIAKAMTRLVPLKAFSKHWHLMVAGYGLPLLCIVFSAGILYNDYPKNPSCWVDTNTDVLYSTSIPIGFFCIISLLLLVAAFCLRPSENYEVDEESFLRERVLENTRWVMLLLLLLMTVAWACGMVGGDSYDESLFLVFIIFNILIGVCVLILRCFGDAEVRTRIRQCCSGGKISPEDDDPQIFLPTKDPTRYNKFTPPQTAGGFIDKNQMMLNRAYVFQP